MNIHFRNLARWILGTSVLAGLSQVAFAEDPIPKPLPSSRFEKLAAHSPFAPPTVVVGPAATPPPPPPPKEFEKYTLALIMQQGNGYIATLNNKETSQHSRVKSNEENEDGIALASVEWSSDVTQTKVTLRKGQEFGVVGFDASGMTAAPAPNPVIPQRPNMQRPGIQPPGGIRPPPGNASVPGQPGSNPNVVRRNTVIRGPAQPQGRPAPRPGNPGVNFQRAPGPPIPGARPLGNKGNDDDDDE